MVESIMILLVLFESGVEVRGVDRHRLMRRPMLADPRQMGETCDATRAGKRARSIPRHGRRGSLPAGRSPSVANVDGHSRSERVTSRARKGRTASRSKIRNRWRVSLTPRGKSAKSTNTLYGRRLSSEQGEQFRLLPVQTASPAIELGHLG